MRTFGVGVRRKKKRRELGKKKCGYKFEEQIKKRDVRKTVLFFFFVTNYEKKK